MSQQFFIFVSFPNTVLLSCNISWKETKEVTQELAILSPNTPNWSRILFPLKRKLNLQKFNEPPAKSSKDWVFWWRKMLKYHRRKLTESQVLKTSFVWSSQKMIKIHIAYWVEIFPWKLSYITFWHHSQLSFQLILFWIVSSPCAQY